MWTDITDTADKNLIVELVGEYTLHDDYPEHSENNAAVGGARNTAFLGETHPSVLRRRVGSAGGAKQ